MADREWTNDETRELYEQMRSDDYLPIYGQYLRSCVREVSPPFPKQFFKLAGITPAPTVDRVQLSEAMMDDYGKIMGHLRDSYGLEVEE